MSREVGVDWFDGLRYKDNMEITYLGHSAFKIKTKGVSIVCDPFSPKKVGFKFTKEDADIVTVSHNHDDHNYLEGVKNPGMVLNAPGEYEIKSISIIGVDSYHDNKKGAERGLNTIYIIESEGLRVAHLGDLGEKLSEKKLEEFMDVDILMIPVGGYYTIGPEEANEIVRSIEPNIVLPMHYKVAGMASTFDKLSTVDEYLKGSNITVEKLPKLSLKFTDLGEEQKIILLEKK